MNFHILPPIYLTTIITVIVIYKEMSVAKSMSFYELPMFQKNWSIRKELLFLKALTVYSKYHIIRVGTENWV